ncbi:MAG: thiamine-phosphate kinase [Burkholderiales bacterium]
MPSEFEIIARHFSRPARHARLGVGDDAALIAVAPGMELAVSTDLLIEGRHFAAGAEPRALGHKALAVNLSDMAAMGASPRWATLALALPEADEAWIAAFADGFYALAVRFGVDLVGGDTTRGPLAICVTILGEVPAGRALTRAGARPGDEVWVSGALGGAAYALEHPEDAAAAKRLHEPEPRVALGERLLGLATAAIDVSDGFAQDLGHVLERSGVGAAVRYADLPKHPIADAGLRARCVLSGGDDYELVFTAPAAANDAISRAGATLGLALARVGTVSAGPVALKVLDERGATMALERGFDHFAA